MKYIRKNVQSRDIDSIRSKIRIAWQYIEPEDSGSVQKRDINTGLIFFDHSVDIVDAGDWDCEGGILIYR